MRGNKFGNKSGNKLRKKRIVTKIKKLETSSPLLITPAIAISTGELVSIPSTNKDHQI
jgi:hypothetical protein